MANSNHLTLLKQGIAAWHEWRQSNRGITPDLISTDLREANLRGADLTSADLRMANLRGANLSGADLRRANLSGANLFMADLSGANLSRADLSEADLSGADLSRADLGRADLSGANILVANFGEVDLSGANLRGADLSGTDLSEVKLRNTLFPGINLAGVKGLDTCHHEGPSHLDFQTLQQSGPLPLAFLRECGLPDRLIECLSSLLHQPMQRYPCFISYSSKDKDFAQVLHADLKNNGIRCWLAPHDVQEGQKLDEQIGETIRRDEKRLLILSEHSMNSEWVKTEIAEAWQREVCEKHQVLFPISLVDYEAIKQWECFNADIGKDSAREIREYFIPDFSNWKSHEAYQQAFDRLLRDLKLELERQPEAT